MFRKIELVLAAAVLLAACPVSHSAPVPEGPLLAPHAPSSELPWEPSCTDTLLCLLACEGRQCGLCIEVAGLMDTPLAALDALACAPEVCPEPCGAAMEDLDACLSCLTHRCPGPTAACLDESSLEYEARSRGAIERCWGSRVCRAECFNDDDECHYGCYWDTAPRARVALWSFRALVDTACEAHCGEGFTWDCEACVSQIAEDPALRRCLVPDPEPPYPR